MTRYGILIQIKQTSLCGWKVLWQSTDGLVFGLVRHHTEYSRANTPALIRRLFIRLNNKLIIVNLGQRWRQYFTLHLKQKILSRFYKISLNRGNNSHDRPVGGDVESITVSQTEERSLLSIYGTVSFIHTSYAETEGKRWFICTEQDQTYRNNVCFVTYPCQWRQGLRERT